MEVLLRNRVCHLQNNNISNHADRLPSQFAVYNTILLKHGMGIVKDLDGIIEVDSVFASIALGLRLVPLE